MTKVSLICASPPRANTGMVSVDVAWEKVQLHCDLDMKVEKFRFDNISFRDSERDQYHCLGSDLKRALEADVIIYWGDFLQMNHYHEEIAARLRNKGIVSSLEEGMNLVHDAFLLRSSSNGVIRKAISFGGTLLLDSPKELISEPYFTNLSRFLKGSHAWMPRDYYSANLGAMIRGEARPTQGVDCALLATDATQRANEESVSEPESRSRRKPIGVFFARSKVRNFSLGRFAKRIAEKDGRATIWVPWIDVQRNSRRGRLKSRLAAFSIDDNKSGYLLDMRRLDWMNDFQFVITDTYHFCVNAWARGIPAICVGDTITHSNKDVSSGKRFSWKDKRYGIYQMFDALDFFVHGSELDHRKNRMARIEHLIDCLHDEKLIKWIRYRIATTTEGARKNLVDNIHSVVGGRSYQ